jgi:excisionase family DNA binding protein
MNSALTSHTQPAVLPVPHEVKAANNGRELAAYLSTKSDVQLIQITDDHQQTHSLSLPTSALRMLVDILAELSDGNAVKVVPIHAELTTQEAADHLNVSRPHLVKLLEEGSIPFHLAGKHRRVKFSDLMTFKADRDRKSAEAMDALSDQAQELNMGYE